MTLTLDPISPDLYKMLLDRAAQQEVAVHQVALDALRRGLLNVPGLGTTDTGHAGAEHDLPLLARDAHFDRLPRVNRVAAPSIGGLAAGPWAGCGV